jgi:hypothetical protein
VLRDFIKKDIDFLIKTNHNTNMKIKLEKNYQIATTTNAEHEHVIRTLYAIGFKRGAYPTANEAVEGLRPFSAIQVYKEGDIGGNFQSSISGLTVVTLNELVRILTGAGLYASVQISDEYKAIVTKEGVQVGCQNVTFERFDELAAVVKRVREG